MAAPAAAQNLRAGVLGGYRRLLRLRKQVKDGQFDESSPPWHGACWPV
jgi:hypothetical protein